jgi:hypothetical protein
VRPVTEDGLPFIGAIPGVDGAYVATGHSVWGLLNAPATSEAMSELILDGAARHVDLMPFAPRRLPPFDPARLRDLAEAPPALDRHVARSGRNVSRLNATQVTSRSTCHPTSPRSFRDPALTGRRAPPRGSPSFAGVVVDRRNGLRARQTSGSPSPHTVRRIANQRAVLGAARGAADDLGIDGAEAPSHRPFGVRHAISRSHRRSDSRRQIDHGAYASRFSLTSSCVGAQLPGARAGLA